MCCSFSFLLHSFRCIANNIGFGVVYKSNFERAMELSHYILYCISSHTNDNAYYHFQVAFKDKVWSWQTFCFVSFIILPVYFVCTPLYHHQIDIYTVCSVHQHQLYLSFFFFQRENENRLNHTCKMIKAHMNKSIEI